MSLYSALARKGPNGFGYGTTAEEVTAGLDLRGRHVLVTGCNSGLGEETVRVLASRGATVLAAARTEDKARETCGRVSGSTVPLACELSEPASVHACVTTVVASGIALDAIICNAGIMALPTLRQKLGYELQFFTNHVGHFLLVTGLLDHLAPAGRVVMVSSGAHKRAPPAGIELDNLSGERGYTPWSAYGQSKLANLLFARELARRMAGSDRVANALHPGVIATNLTRHMGAGARAGFAAAGAVFMKTIPQGAATQCWAAVHPASADITGEYLADCNISASSAKGRDMNLAAALWAKTEAIVAELS
jgi:WW domain-containing oxidoreductase